MKLRYGIFTLFENIEMSVSEYNGHGLNQELEKNHLILSYSQDYGKLNGFTLDKALSIFKKDILIKDLQNAFLIITKAKYMGETFEVVPYFGDEIHLHLTTKDYELGKKLNFYKLHDENNKPYYLGEIKIFAVEKIWEVRQKSIFNVPMPENIERVKIIKT